MYHRGAKLRGELEQRELQEDRAGEGHLSWGSGLLGAHCEHGVLHGTTLQGNTEKWSEVWAGEGGKKGNGTETLSCEEELNDLAAMARRRKCTIVERCSIHQAEQVRTRG